MSSKLVEASFTALGPPSKSNFQTHHKTFRVLKKGYGKYLRKLLGNILTRETEQNPIFKAGVKKAAKGSTARPDAERGSRKAECSFHSLSSSFLSLLRAAFSISFFWASRFNLGSGSSISTTMILGARFCLPRLFFGSSSIGCWHRFVLTRGGAQLLE